MPSQTAVRGAKGSKGSKGTAGSVKAVESVGGSGTGGDGNIARGKFSVQEPAEGKRGGARTRTRNSAFQMADAKALTRALTKGIVRWLAPKDEGGGGEREWCNHPDQHIQPRMRSSFYIRLDPTTVSSRQ